MNYMDTIHTLDKYKQNLKVGDLFVYSYGTAVAKIFHLSKTIQPIKHYSQTTSKHINYVGQVYDYRVLPIEEK